ncbi:hypothetical protein B0H21DRAFT_434472 [Amylocystis lapponica]|nr:hypothetical protein B0H21DRAFT_434472 [Amylocystis lapponica]
MDSPASPSLGPIFIGMILNIFLYGVTVAQIFIYYNTYKKDRPFLKLFVGFLLLADTLSSIFDIACAYIPLVVNSGNLHDLEFASWLFATEPAMTVLLAIMVQIFFKWRVKVLTGNTYLVCFIVFCAICQVCGGLGTSIAVGVVPEYAQFQKFEAIVIVWIIGAVLTDTTITIALVWRLKTHQHRFPTTMNRLNKIIRLTVQTGLVMTVVEIVNLILFLADDTGIHLIFNIPLGRLYTNSLMSSLNSRTGWTDGAASDGNASSLATHGKTLQFTREAVRSGLEVFIDIEEHEMTDIVDRKQSLPSPFASVEPTRKGQAI